MTLVAMERDTDRPLRKVSKRVQCSNVWANIMSQKSDIRREERLVDKAMLQKVCHRQH